METITTKEQALELIQSIVKNERFKVDAYFFCGFPTDQPNEKLIQLCESYLEKQDTETKTAMLAEMERMVSAGSVLDAGKNVLGSTADVQRVLEAKRLGFTKVILPKSSLEQVKDVTGIELVGVSAVWDAMKCL